MQFTQNAHPAIADGSITLTFRLWKTPHAKVGGRYRVGAVEVEVDDIEMVPFHSITKGDLARTGAPDLESLRALAAHAGPIDDDTVLYRIEFHVAGPRRHRVTDVTDDAATDAVIVKLDAMDARSKRGAWTREVLRLIGDHEGLVSTELAARVGRPRLDFKVDVRKLKALGLTDSLEVGYRLTGLGRAVVARSR